MICPHCNKEIDDSEWVKIPELGIEVQREVHDKNQSWDDLGLSNKEDKLLTAEQCIFIMNNEKYAKILKMDGSSTKNDFFIKQYSPFSKKNGYVAWFCSDSDGTVLRAYYYSGDSDSSLGVRFVRPLKVKKK